MYPIPFWKADPESQCILKHLCEIGWQNEYLVLKYLEEEVIALRIIFFWNVGQKGILDI